MSSLLIYMAKYCTAFHTFGTTHSQSCAYKLSQLSRLSPTVESYRPPVILHRYSDLAASAKLRPTNSYVFALSSISPGSSKCTEV